jgi:hypothetical protein
MKKLVVIAVLGMAALALTSSNASAGWLKCWPCKHHCVMSLTCTQYNAFSPYCCDQANGCVPLQAFANACNGSNCGASCVGGACLGELPATNGHAMLNAAPNGAIAMPGATMPMYGAINPMPNAPGIVPQPMAVPSYSAPTFMGAAPVIGQ